MPPLPPPPPSAPAAGAAAPDEAEEPEQPQDPDPHHRWVIQWCLDGWHDARDVLARMLDASEFFVRPLDPNGPSLAEQCRGAHVLVPTTGHVDARCIAAAAPTLKLIAQPASAVGNIDLVAAKQAGVAVTHAPGHNAAATAEVALLLLLLLLRRASEAPAMIAAREVGRPVGREARGRTLGVVGITGRVGRRVARAAAALGMRVIGVDSKGARVEFSAAEDEEEEEEEEEDGRGGRSPAAAHAPPDQATSSAATAAAAAPAAAPTTASSPSYAAFKRGLHALLEESDAVSLHIPLSARTEGLFGREEFCIMARRGAIFVNTARAAIVDRPSLEEALGPTAAADDGKGGGGPSQPPCCLAGAGLDVMWEEPCDPRDPLLTHPRVVVLPHLGCASEEAYAALAGVLARNIRRAREGRWGDLEHRVC